MGQILLPHSFPRKDSLESILFSTLADAGASTLSTAQSGIYAMEELLIAYEQWDSLEKAEEELNKRYLSYAMNRGRMFHTETLSATGSLSLSKYYICSAVVLFLFAVWRMGNYSYFSSEPESLKLLLKRQGISSLFVLFSKLMAISGICFLAISDCCTCWFSAALWYRRILYPYFFRSIPPSVFFGSICSQSGSYILVSAVLSILCLFLSGAFYSTYLSPETIRQIGSLLPTTLFLRLCRELLTDTLSISSILNGIITGLTFLLASSFFL